MGIVAIEGVAVADHPGGRVETGDGQGIAQASGDALRKARRYAAADHGDTADSQGLQAVQGGHREGAALGQGRGIRAAAGGQVLLIDSELASLDLQAPQQHRVVIVVHLQHQVGGAGVAIGISQGIGEGFSAAAAALERQEGRIAGVHAIGVTTVRRQHQGAEGAIEGAGSNRSGRHPISALHIIGQHIAAQGQLAFRGGACVVVIDCRRHIVGDIDVKGVAGRVAIAVDGNHAELLAQAVGAIRRRVQIIAIEGVAVADHPGGRVEAGDGQGIAQAGGNGLWKSRRHAAADHIDATDIQTEQPIRGRDCESATLGQGRRIACRALLQVGFIDREFTALHRKPTQAHRVVGGCTIDRQQAIDALRDKFGDAIEARCRKADHRLDPAPDFLQQNKAVTAALGTRRATGTGGARRSGFGGLGWVITGGNGLLQLFDIAQLRIAGCQHLRGIDLSGLLVKQLRRQLLAAVTAQGQILAILQMHCHRTFGSSDQLLTDKQPVPLHQETTGAIRAYRVNLPDHLGHNAD